MRFLIKGGNVVLNERIQKLDVLVENERITQIGEHLSASSFSSTLLPLTVLNCENLFLLPGLVDMHVHLREPGFCYKETLLSGCEAAAAGGFAAVCCMPNTKPVIDSAELIQKIIKKSEKCYAKVHVVAAITKNLEGAQLVNFTELSKAGAVAFSDDGNCLENSFLMEQALLQAEANNKVIISHCENTKLSSGGLLNKGKISEALKLKGISNESESTTVALHIELAKKLNCRVHIAHVSTKESILAIRKAKQEGVKVTAETCPHYFCLTEDELLSKNANFKINPPLRSETDRIEIEKAVLDQTIDCIATDHAPHSKTEKQNFLTAPCGAIGLETSLACVLTHFFHTKKLNLLQIVNLMAKKPCEILNLNFDGIKPGAEANFSIVDLDKLWVVEPEKFKSKSSNSPFEGKTLKGKVLKTFFKGKLVFS